MGTEFQVSFSHIHHNIVLHFRPDRLPMFPRSKLVFFFRSILSSTGFWRRDCIEGRGEMEMLQEH